MPTLFCKVVEHWVLDCKLCAFFSEADNFSVTSKIYKKQYNIKPVKKNMIKSIKQRSFFSHRKFLLLIFLDMAEWIPCF